MNIAVIFDKMYRNRLD